nr:hypothetical protein [Tanacetum cinerariifolium]
DSLLDEFAGELTLLKSISPGIDETDCDFKEDIRFIEKLLYDNSSSHPLKEFVSANSDAASESFSPSPILVKDSDSLMEEIDLFCTPDYPMPPGIEDKDYDSERDILIPKDLPSNNSLSFAKKESFHFDIPPFSHPPAKPPDGDTGILNINLMGDIYDQKAFMHKLMITLAPHQKKSPNFLSHRCGTVKKFNTHRSHLNKCPMMIHGQNNPPLDVLLECISSKGSVEDKILVPKPPKNCARCAKCEHPDNDTSESSDDSTNVVNAPREPFVVKHDHGVNPPHIDKCCCECGNALDGIFCQQCICKSCGKGAHTGYNCPPKVPIVSNPESCNQTMNNELPQTFPSFGSVPCVSKPNFVDKSSNIFNPPPQPPIYYCEFCGSNAQYGHYCTPQAPIINPEPGYSQYFNFLQNIHDFQQQYLCCDQCEGPHETFQCQQVIFHEPCCENYGGPHENFQCQPYQPTNEGYYHEQNSCYNSNYFGTDHCQTPQYTVNHPIFDAHNDFLNSQNELSTSQPTIMEQMMTFTSMCEMVCQIFQKKQEEKRIEEEQAANARYWKILACCDDDDDYDSAITPVLSTEEPVNSLSMGDEHLDTISATKSDEVIKSSVEDLVPIPSESEGENGCDMPSCFTTFSNILFDADYDFESVDDQSLHNEDVSKKIFSYPLFEEEIISIRKNQHHFNVESDLVESMLNRDSSIISSSSKIDSLLDEFAGIDKTECHPENEIRLS